MASLDFFAQEMFSGFFWSGPHGKYYQDPSHLDHGHIERFTFVLNSAISEYAMLRNKARADIITILMTDDPGFSFETGILYKQTRDTIVLPELLKKYEKSRRDVEQMMVTTCAAEALLQVCIRLRYNLLSYEAEYTRCNAVDSDQRSSMIALSHMIPLAKITQWIQSLGDTVSARTFKEALRHVAATIGKDFEVMDPRICDQMGHAQGTCVLGCSMCVMQTVIGSIHLKSNGIPAMRFIETPPAATPISHCPAHAYFVGRYPAGYSQIIRGGSGMASGFDAIVYSLKRNYYLQDMPTPDQFRELSRSSRVLSHFSRLGLEDWPIYHTDRLGAILYFWGIERGLNIQLGVLAARSGPYIVPHLNIMPSTVVWIQSTNIATESVYSHENSFSAIVPKLPIYLQNPSKSLSEAMVVGKTYNITSTYPTHKAISASTIMNTLLHPIARMSTYRPECNGYFYRCPVHPCKLVLRATSSLRIHVRRHAEADEGWGSHKKDWLECGPFAIVRGTLEHPWKPEVWHLGRSKIEHNFVNGVITLWSPPLEEQFVRLSLVR